jgi:hypothetical protein
MIALAKFSELLFKLLDKSSAGECAAIDHLLHRICNFVFDRFVLGFEIEKWYFHTSTHLVDWIN